MSTPIRRLLYVVLGLLAFVVVLVIGVVIALQVPAVQDYAARKAADYLQNKIGTEVRINKFRTDWRNGLALDGVYLEDQQGDTLLSVGHLGVGIDLWALTKSQINVKNVELTDGRVNIERTLPDSTYNFDYILAAFATGDTATTTPADSTGGFKYDIGDVHLARVLLTYRDQVDGMNVRGRVGDLAVNMNEVDVDRSIFRIGNVALRNTGFNIVQTKVPPDTPAEPLTLTLDLDRATLDNVALNYRNDPSGQDLRTRIGQALVTADNIDLIRQRIDLNTLKLRNATIAYAQNENVPVEQRVLNPAQAVQEVDSAVAKATAGPTTWRVALKQSDLSGVRFAFDNVDEPRQRTRLPAMDYNHLLFDSLALRTRNLVYTDNRTTGRIDLLRGREQSGFRVDRAKADVVYDSVQIRLDNLDLVTPHTRIRRTLAIGFDSLGALADTRTLGKTRIEADLRNTRLGFRDILYLAPDLITEKPFTTGPNQSVLISGQVNGRIGNFALNNLELVGFRNTVVRASGRIQGLPNTDRRLYTDLNIRQLSSTAADVKSLVPAGTIPSNIQLPERFSVAGTVRGRPTAQIIDANLRANTSFGNATAVVNMEPGPAGREPVAARFTLDNFNVGALIRDPTIGRLSATGRYTGQGLNPETMRGKLVANVGNFRYNNYTYRNVDATVDVNGQQYAINARSQGDANAAFNLQATVDLRNPNAPRYTFGGSVNSLNLTALGFYQGGQLSLSGDLKSNLSGSDLNTLNGTLTGDNVVVKLNGQPIVLDSLNTRIVQVPGRTELDFSSAIASATLRGNTRLGDIATELQRHIDRYFDLPDVQYRPSAADRQFTFAVQVPESGARLLPKFVPGLTRITPFVANGAYNSRAADLQLRADVASIVYQGTNLDSLRLRVDSDAQRLGYALNLRSVRQDTTLSLARPSLVGSVANNQVGTRLRIAGADSTQRLDLAGVLQVLGGGNTYQFSVDERLVLDNRAWTVAPGNVLRYSPTSGNIEAQNFRIARNEGAADRFLELQTLPGARNPLQVRIGNFDLNALGRAAGLQDSLVGGLLNGQAVAYDLGRKGQAFTADLALTNLLYEKYALGDVRAQVVNNVANRYDIIGQLTNTDGTDVRVTGNYVARGNIDVVANVNRLNMKTIEPFSAGQIVETSGALAGRLTITGPTEVPKLRGALRFQDAGFTLAQLGSPFRLPNDELVLNDQGLQFRDFAILDSLNNRAVINGYIAPARALQEVGKYRLDLRVVTDDFIAVQSTRRENPLYYGRLLVDSDTRVSGTLYRPAVRTRATVVDGSDLSVVVPSDDPVAVEREGIVVFVDKDAPKVDTTGLAQVPPAANIDSSAVATGYDVQANITLTDRTPFTIVIDETAGDNLRVRAEGTLNAELNERGAQSLVGRLGVTQGEYQLSLYDLAERKFTIGPDSYIQWTGDPFNAQMNVAAIYRVRAVPADLVANELGEGSNAAENRNLARNRMPFDVYLNVTEQLLKPKIGFDIRLPENVSGPLVPEVRTKLQQLRQPSEQNELNKQVFALLALGRFIADNPFRSTSAPGGLVENQLRGSASQVLTDQLNNLTGEYLAGLGLELGVDSYATTTGTGAQSSRTDLNVAVRRQLLNDRLTVRLGTDVPLAGGASSGQQSGRGAGAASQFAGDVSIEYNVLPDGRLRLRAFRNNAYEDIDGQFVRTGTSLIFQRDYNSLQELFAGISPEVKEQVKTDRRARKAEKAAEQDTLRNNALN